MLVHLLNTPKSDREWDVWSFHNRTSHLAIIQAIQTQKNITLTQYQLDPISPKAVPDFLQRNSQSHIDMNSVLNLQTVDLQDVDLKNRRQLEAWIFLHWKEHSDAEQSLGISS
jgi:hypothetical protein